MSNVFYEGVICLSKSDELYMHHNVYLLYMFNTSLLIFSAGYNYISEDNS